MGDLWGLNTEQAHTIVISSVIQCALAAHQIEGVTIENAGRTSVLGVRAPPRIKHLHPFLQRSALYESKQWNQERALH
jgi:hypothetical protein